jgi:hypothetical protein
MKFAFFAALLVVRSFLQLADGFTERCQSQRMHATTTYQTMHSSTASTPNDEVRPMSACPFSKRFPKYRIDLNRRDKKKNQSWPSLPILGLVQNSMDRRKLEQKFQDCEVQWISPDTKAVSVFTNLWNSAATLYEPTTTSSRTVLGFSEASQLGVAQNWVDIVEWMQNESAVHPFLGDMSMKTSIHKEGQLLAIELCRQGVPAPSKPVTTYDPEILTRRTQSWVKRILVDQGICPFTKSVKVSGQGLGDLGIPVAKIHYCSSTASPSQICRLMADTWKEIAFMLDMGPSGKNGISSILLAAPEYDNDFDLWSGPIFAMLESGVVACRLEKQVGIVCFHPAYATPDGSSFPGFGHMHSVPRLKKWLNENDSSLTLSDNEIAAGGAWQRRTPHATINVLRAEQLEAAEKRRNSGELYTENIRKLSSYGYEKLSVDLETDRSLR